MTRIAGIALVIGTALSAMGLACGAPGAGEAEPRGNAAEGPPNLRDAVLGSTAFELVHNQVLFPVHLGEHGPYHMILDTAGSPSAIHLATALEAGLAVDLSRAGEADGVGGERVAIYGTRLDELEVGGHAASGIQAVALDLGRVSSQLGRRLDGVLGKGFLEGRIVAIDYPGRTLSILSHPPASASREEAPATTFPLRFSVDGIAPVCTLLVDGVRIPVTIDTGSSLTLELYRPGIEALGLDRSDVPGERQVVVGARGAAERESAIVGGIALGPLHLPAPTVSLVRDEDGGDGEWGNLGNGFLRHFHLTLDYVHGTVTLARGAPQREE